MRLTLRTLLAYLDDILEPSQAREIGDKLNESSFAASLVSRIREVMRRRRLTAPTLSGPGVGIDPNTIAEYLDNTLPPDGVADVEKICLESDVHLAEAAACHQILTLALGEPVEVSPQTRERMYALGPAAAKMTVGASDGQGSNGLASHAIDDVLAQAPDAHAHHRQAVSVGESHPRAIPDYLRPRANVKRMLLYSLVAIVVIVWGVLMIKISPFKSGAGQTQNVAMNGPAGVKANADQAAQAAAIPDQPEPDGGSAEAGGAAADEATGVGDQKESGAGQDAKRVASIDLAPDDEADDDAPAPRKRKVLEGAKDDSEPVPQPVDNGDSSPTPAGDSNPPAPLAPVPSNYVSSVGVTLHYVPRDERWFMLPRRALVHAGDTLAVPDPFQCELEIEGGKGMVTIMPRTLVQVLGPTDAGSFGLEVRRGQFVVRPLGSGGERGSGGEAADSLRLGVAIAGELWRLAIQPGATCGVQVNLMEPPKIEDAVDKNSYLGAIYVVGGTAVVTDPAGHEIEIKGTRFLQLPLLAGTDAEGPRQTTKLDSVPSWLGGQTLTPTAQNYARIFEKKFTLKDSIELSIPEVVADPPNPEIARLATECLGLVEDFGPLVEALHRPYRESRKAAISGLRLWLARNPENKDLLKPELTKRYPPEEAEALYRLLLGFNAEDARDKTTSLQLVDWMGDPEIAIRELAFYHVERLTGKTHDYRPDYSPVQLKSTLLVWKRQVAKEGALLPPQKPIPNPQ
ncbi:MAG TPA: hypothetical protein VKU82_12325 [Planctomycetaceae bacterium]|nr:hypothetical protein [Planctomycetaceae bacterium]